MAQDEKPARVTMKDVAKQAGVSQSTVSFVLNGMDEMRIGEETRAKVLEAVKVLGYVPRGAGRPKNAPMVRVFALMIDEIATSPFGAITVEAVQEAAWEEGISVSIAMTGGNAEYEDVVLRRWKAEGVEAVIYASILTRHVTPPKALLEHKCVVLNGYDDSALPSVTPAERRGGYEATRYLIDRGYRRIAFIAGEDWMDASRQREEGFRRAMLEAGLPIEKELIAQGNFLPDGGRLATLALLDLPKRPEAIFCANDYTALGAYEAIKERGLRVADDIGVMGYDDLDLARQLTPELSTVVLPYREMARWAVRQLLKIGEAQSYRMPCPLMPRQSC